MKVANIIIAHKNPDQLLRLINLYKGELFHNFIHIDARCNLNEYKEIINHPNVTLLPKRRKVVWAGYSFVKVTIEALKLIKEREERFFYFNLMSGMDFPLKPTGEFYDHLLNAYPSGIEFFEISDLSIWPGKHRYERYHLNEWTIKGRYFTERIINWFIGKREFYGGKFIPYGRSAWFSATDHFIDYSLRYFEEHPEYLSFMKTVWNPDEFVFTSLIMNSPFKDKVGPHNLRHIDWSEEKAHPKLFKEVDYEDLIKSNKYLARKFDESVDRRIIEKLETNITSQSK